MDLTGKVSLVTGATGGMGRVVATELARLGSTVVITARDGARGQRLEAEIGAEVLVGDLSRRRDVHRIAEEFTARHPTLHLLVNNAGAHFARRMVNDDGVELHVAVNYLAGFLLTGLLRERLTAAPAARVVNVVSNSMNDTRQVKVRREPRPVDLDPEQLDDLRSLNPAVGFDPFADYARSKLLTVMGGYRFAEELDGVTVNAVHPGLAGTAIVDALTPWYMAPFSGMIRRSLPSPREAAASILRVATDPALDGTTGRYFDRDAEACSPDVSYDQKLQQRLWESSLAHLRP